jgi:iron complex outermembrane recepter protein
MIGHSQLNSRKGRGLLLAGIATIFASSPALAQSASEAEDAGNLEEILVTANKREQNLQQAPLAITAISAVQAELRGVTEVKDIASLAPNVTVLQGTTNATAAVVTIRGIATAADESQGFDSPIGIYLDGVYIARSSAASNEVADIARIEVLRGPQGTLFGRNTTGGAVNFITREPGSEAMLKVRAGVGNYGLLQTRAIADTGDIGDGGLRMSFGFVYKRRNGTVDNLLESRNSRDPGSYRTIGGRWATVFEPRDNLKITNVFDYTKVRGVLPATQLAALGDGVPRGTTSVGGGVFNNTTPANVAGFFAQPTTTIVEPGCTLAPSLTRRDSLCSEGAFEYSDKIWGNMFRVEAGLGGVKVRSTTAYREWQNIQLGTDLDGLGTIRGAALGPPATTLNGFPAAILSGVLQQPAGTAAFLASQPVNTATFSLFQTDNVRKNKQFSQEIEILSQDADTFEWVLGGFYFKESGTEVNPQRFGFVLDTNAAVYSAANFGGAAPFLQPVNPARYRVALQNPTLAYSAEGTSYAIYGQGTYRPGGKDGQLGITLGLRYSWDKKRMARTQNGPTPFAGADIGFNDQRANFSAPTGNLTIDYRATDDVNLYARVARGYRSGGFNARQGVVTAALPLLAFDNETIWSYEAGFKTQFARKLRLNGAFFYNVYSDLQLATFSPTTAGGAAVGTVVGNVGKTSYTGFELEGQYQLNDIFSIDGNLGYTKIKFKEYNQPDSTGNIGNIGSLVKPGYAPEWTASIAGTAKFPIGGDANATFRLGYNYSSDFFMFGNPIAAPFIQQTKGDARGLLDAQLKLDGFTFGGVQDVSLLIWGKNLTNKEYRVRSVDFGQLGFAYTVYGEPRTFGATLEVKF